MGEGLALQSAGGIEPEAVGDELIEKRLESGNLAVELGLHKQADSADARQLLREAGVPERTIIGSPNGRSRN